MVCSICGSMNHNRSNKKFHGKGLYMKNSYPNPQINMLAEEIVNAIKGGAVKKGLLADLLKGIDLRIQSL